MSIISDCWNYIRGVFRECMTTPMSKKKLLIFGGIFVFLVILIIILVVCLRGDSSSSTSVTPVTGRKALAAGPASFQIKYNVLKEDYKNMINNKKPEELVKELNLSLPTDTTKAGITMIWPVGASDCVAASQKDAVSQTLEEIDAAIRVNQKLSSNMSIATTRQELVAAKSASNIGVVLSLDGGYTIDSRMAVLRTMYSLGVRIMTLTGTCSTPWAGDVSATTITLTDFGKSVIQEANRLGIILDLAGSSAATIKEVLANSKAPVIFKGVGAMNLTKDARNLDNATLQTIKSRGKDLVMVSFRCSEISSSTNCNYTDVIDHINSFASIVGKGQVGIEGTFNTDPLTVQGANIPAMFDAMHSSPTDGWTMQELEGLAYGNFLSVFQQVESVASNMTSEAPAEALEPVNDFSNFPKDNITCYTDQTYRFGPNGPTAPTAAPTAAPKPDPKDPPKQ